MKINIIPACIVLFFAFFNIAQSQNDEVLFTVGETPVFASEFVRVYNKNLNLVKDESQKDIDQYLELFVNYKLKLAEAKALDFHKKPQYVREFEGYKKQLAKNYLTDNEVTDALVKEAYDRTSYDVNARHILLRIDPSNNDTLSIYNKLVSLRDRFKNEDFQLLQKELHNGNTMLVEDLGYFSAFKMVYEFETMAYNTNMGEVSMPFRTQFGFHIVKVLDKRPSRGEVTVGHIMISNNQSNTTTDPEARIQEIYKLIEQGQEFESLAKQFSQDRSSSQKGGKLAPFKTGQLSSVVFEDIAFNLENEGQISKPFKTEYGWHIVKLYNKKPIGAFEDVKYDLENKVSRDSRSKLISSSMHKKLIKKYSVNTVNPARDYFISILNDEFYNRKWSIPENFDSKKVLLTIGKRNWTYKDFVGSLRSQQKATTIEKSFEVIIDEAYEAFLNKCVLIYHEDNLENDNQEFAQILNEYREGLLLFDLMETKIWNAVKKDSVGIEAYYNKHKNNYKYDKQVEAVVATTSKEKDITEVIKLFKKGEDIESIKSKLNTSKEQKVIITSGTMTADHQALPDNFEFKKGVSKIYEQNGAYFVVNVSKIVPERIRTLDEARGLVISDYQNIVEKEWLEELRNKFSVTINNNVLNKVKAEINK